MTISPISQVYLIISKLFHSLRQL